MLLQSCACPRVARGEVSSPTNKITRVVFGVGDCSALGAEAEGWFRDSPRGEGSEMRLLTVPVP